MMAITRAKLGSNSDFLAWLQANAVPNIFASVSMRGDGSTVQALDDDGNVAFLMQAGQFIAYVNDNVQKSYSNGYALITNGGSDDDKWTDIIGCDNGFILEAKSGVSKRNLLVLMCAKTNNGKVAVVFASGDTSSRTTVLRSSIQHIARGDNPSLETTTSFSPESAAQTVLTPFATNANIGDVSYTPDAFYMPMHSAYSAGLGKFSLGSDIFITNGYWAIRDGGGA